MDVTWADRVTALCVDIKKHVASIEKGKAHSRVIAYYLKLLELKHEAPSAANGGISAARDLAEVDLLSELDYLYEYIDPEHELKQASARHLQVQPAIVAPLASTTRFLFDGRDRRLWHVWRHQLTLEVEKSALSEENKYAELLSRVTTGSRAWDEVMNHSGSSSSFASAVTALDREYGDREAWIVKHIQELRSMTKDNRFGLRRSGF